jgi:hypothetical protein
MRRRGTREEGGRKGRIGGNNESEGEARRHKQGDSVNNCSPVATV